jgi:hypothetical protein
MWDPHDDERRCEARADLEGRGGTGWRTDSMLWQREAPVGGEREREGGSGREGGGEREREGERARVEGNVAVLGWNEAFGRES